MPTVADLLFRQAPNPTTQPVELLFGQLEALPDQSIQISGALPGLQGTILAGKATRGVVVAGALPALQGRVRIGVPRVASLSGSLPSLGGRIVVGDPTIATVAGALPGLGGVATARFNVNVDRPVVGEVGATWQRAQRASLSVEDRQQQPAKLQPGVATQWAPAVPVRAGVESLKPRSLMPVRVSGEARRTPALVPARVVVQSLFEDAIRIRRSADAGYEEAEARRAEWASAYQDRVRLRSAAADALQSAAPLRRLIEHLQSSAVPVRLSRSSWWQEAMVPPPGWGWKPPVPPDPDLCYLPDPHLVFASAAAVDGNLVFVCERHDNPPGNNTVIVPIRRAYMVMNTASLRRLGSGVDLPSEGFSLSLDWDSWTWKFSTSVQAHALPDLSPDADGAPAILVATVNGIAHHVVVEDLDRTRVFPTRTLSAGGRGINAVLDDPYDPIATFSNSSARTAQQLMLEVLSDNGVPLDWDLDWQIDDWLVPAGAWSFQGTRMAALRAIAAAAGAYIQPHPSERVLRVLHRYPSAPWDWGTLTPDFILPASIVQNEGIAWTRKPAYNRVFVSGQAFGHRSEVTRTGTAGDLSAPSVVDALLTDTPAARQRGRAILSDTGRQALVRLRLPVLSETGIILPGKSVRYEDDEGNARFGLVRSTGLDVKLPDEPEVWQVIGVETHV